MTDEEHDPRQRASTVTAIRTTAGAVVRIEDLPAATLKEIGAPHEIHWTTLVLYPMQDPGALADLVAHCHELVGEDVPADLHQWSAKKLLEAVDRVPEDMPTAWVDGYPKEGDAPTTPSSSGAPDDSDGPPPSSGSSPTET